jgi:lysophospholipase L1-like esterase
MAGLKGKEGPPSSSCGKSMTADLLYVVDRDTPSFEAARTRIDVVCAGDSITGWNNFGRPAVWPYSTYPQFLQERCHLLRLKVANGGIAGEVSQNGIGQVRDYLEWFPNARYFIIGYGTNDLGTWPDLEATSKQIIDNLDQMVNAVLEHGKRSILFNVPNANESMFPPKVAQDTHRRRDYHNQRLEDFCDELELPLVDICSHLRDEHLADELHPNKKGAEVIAEQVFRILRGVLKEHHGGPER